MVCTKVTSQYSDNLEGPMRCYTSCSDVVDRKGGRHMKVAKQEPKPTRCVVKVTDEEYSLWISEPVHLGNITRRSRMWVTEDGQRHASSTDALRYLCALRGLRFEEDEKRSRNSNGPVSKKYPAPTNTKAPQKGRAVKLVEDEAALFKQFQKFMEFQKKGT
jgi:hypothetical protein